MAKAIERNSVTQAADSEAYPLAERLFVQHWNIKSGLETSHVAKLCLDAADTFERVKRECAGLRVTDAA